jgi:type II secretory pathway component GspD/PulD (secretin)
MRRKTTPLLLSVLAVALFSPTALAQGEMTKIEVTEETPLVDFLKSITTATGRALLYDPNNQRIRGQKMLAGFSLEVPRNRLFDTYRAILAFFELNLVPIGPKGYEIYLVIDSRSTNNFVKNKATQVNYDDLGGYSDKDGVYISCAIPVRHIQNLTTLRTALSTMVSPAGIGRVHEVPGSGRIIVMDFAPNVVAMAALVRQMDVENEETKVSLESIELKYAHCELMAETLNELLGPRDVEGQAKPSRGRPSSYLPTPVPPRVVPYEPRNSVAVRATKADLDRIRKLIAALDQPSKQWSAVEVVQLANTSAKEVGDRLSTVVGTW